MARLITKPTAFSVVEVILAGAIFSLLIMTFVGGYLYGQEASALAGARARATLLAEEGLDAVRNIRDEDFALLVDGTYGLNVSGNQWQLLGSNDVVDIFTRSLTISTIDAQRKAINSTVTWQQNTQRVGSVVLSTYLTNWVAVVNALWTTFIQLIVLDLPDPVSGTKIQVMGTYAYVIQASGVDFVIVDLASPGAPSLSGQLTLAGTLRNVYVAGNYAYVASTDNNTELIIVDISNPVVPAIIGNYDDTGNQDAVGVYVVGNYAYVSFNGGDDLVVVDVTNPATPTKVGAVSVAGNANEVSVSGSYAYIATTDNSSELHVVDISTPATPSVVATVDLPGTSDAQAVAVFDNLLLISQGDSAHIVDITIPTSPALLGSYDALDSINDISLQLGQSSTYAFLATSENSTEFQVIDISIPSTPVLFATVDTAGNANLNGVAFDETLAHAFAVGADVDGEFVVFAPQ